MKIENQSDAKKEEQSDSENNKDENLLDRQEIAKRITEGLRGRKHSDSVELLREDRQR